MGCCEDYLTCDIAFNAAMPLSHAPTRRRYSRIEGITAAIGLNGELKGELLAEVHIQQAHPSDHHWSLFE